MKLSFSSLGSHVHRLGLIYGVILCFGSQSAVWAGRQLYICTEPGQSEVIQNAVRDFTARAESVPLFKAMRRGGDLDGVAAKTSSSLLATAAYNDAAHNHLMVVGLRSKDPLLDKIWGFTATITEKSQDVYSLGWGAMHGDIGWIECDRNPFLHSRKIKNAPEDTIIVKISGTTDAGVLAALKAFEKGMLNGWVPAGPITRPKTTLLDLDPVVEPPPFPLPSEIKMDGKPVWFAGWTQIPANEYRAILEVGGVEPKRVWRVKYWTPQLLEQAPIVRWVGGPHSRGFGSAMTIAEFETERAASQTAVRSAREKFKKITVEGLVQAWEGPMATDEELMNHPVWQVVVTRAGRFLFVSTLSREGTAQIAAGVVK